MDLEIQGNISVSTVAERAFLVLSREWLTEYKNQSPIKRDAAQRCLIALACLTLAVEWGQKFSDVARKQIEINRLAVSVRDYFFWLDRLPWKLCAASFLASPLQTEAVHELTTNLDHHDSSTRCWMMEMGWFVSSWLDPEKCTPKLLKNLANTLAYPLLAAGLAAKLYSSAEDFMAQAQAFAPPITFEKQYQNRLQTVDDLGTRAVQAYFWQTEAQCRKEIERTVLARLIHATA